MSDAKQSVGTSEWGILCALHAYLVFTLAVKDNGFVQLDSASIASGNFRDAFSFELTRIFVRSVFSRDFLPEDVDDYQQKLVRLCGLLESLVNIDVIGSISRRDCPPFQHLFLPQDRGSTTPATSYPQLRALLDYLHATEERLDLISGASTPAFCFPADELIANALKTVQDFNDILDCMPEFSIRQGVAPTKETGPSLRGKSKDASFREYAAGAFDALFNYLETCGSLHTIMLHVPREEGIAHNDEEVLLDLFISTCHGDSTWQEAQCGQCKAVKGYVIPNKDLCSIIKESQAYQEGLHLHIIEGKLHNLSQIPQPARHGNNRPNASLHGLVTNGAFKGFGLENLARNRFDRVQKRQLVLSLAQSLLTLFGSKWISKGWCSKDILFHVVPEEKNQTIPNLPFGPFVSCSFNGPALLDFPKWEKKLPPNSTLLLFGKMLLEVDIGHDLEEFVDQFVQKGPTWTVWLALTEIYNKAQSDLDYREAIQACFQFHRFERAEALSTSEQKETWAREYIMERIIQKLKIPQLLPIAKNDQPEKRPKVPPSRITPDLPEATVKVFFGKLTDTSSVASSLKSPLGHRQSSPSPLVDHQRMRTSNIDHPDQGEDADSKIKARTAIAKRDIKEFGDVGAVATSTIERVNSSKNVVVADWLGDLESATDHTATSEINLTSAPIAEYETVNSQMDDYDEVLFDAMEVTDLPSGDERSRAKSARDYWEMMKKFNAKHIPRPIPAVKSPSVVGPWRNHRVKIALIDTGVNLSDSLIRPEQKRFSGRSWVDEDQAEYNDTCGHGTHLARLVLKVTTVADIIVGKVSKDKNFTRENILYIAEAIRWAVEQNADIISLSLGFKNEIPEIKAALQEALNPRGNGVSPKIVFAAAANWGYNFPRAFPASQRGVLCVHAVDGLGYDGKFNPKADPQNRFATLGLSIESVWNGKPVWLSGTSFATPIAAGIAANVLEFAKQKMNLTERGWLRLSSSQGMRGVLRLMCMEVNNFDYLSPWQLRNQGWITDEQIAEKFQEEIDYG